MIDTDKYEGHTPGPWKALFNHPQVDGSCVVNDEDESNFGYTGGPLWVGELTEDMPDTKLIADAPLLLEEVKRLRNGIHFALSYTRPTPHTDDPWVACREFIVEYLKSLIADIRPLSFIPKDVEVKEMIE
jgi:hypothetical protein|tara:strand:+ start:427 stop:816 length:390 start_codon:yes stop_codon:yes gene_type:complete